ncbi:15884_t:CDS:1 [Funneliformis caledonium]|uniref:15884_t:CDS:1 n=1 Tax=Funneliformis caledonium TaxID=1117310 RepID=A0A9N9CXA0_9GLOM|nr:15884_t:CDS:1 [Funneliformis caledonium]
MYLKSTHSQLMDGGHKWEITLFCNTEANSIGSVDITPKSRGSIVVPNNSKPKPTAYTMNYTVSKYDQPPYNFTATITFNKTNETKTVSVPANMATDRKRRKTDGGSDDDDEYYHDQNRHNDGFDDSQQKEQPPSPPEKDHQIKKGKKFLCIYFDGKSKPLSEKDDVSKGKCCIIM